MKNKLVVMSLTDCFMETFRRYLRKHGKRILSIAKLTGQRKVKIGLKGLYWYYEEYPPNYPKLKHLVEDILNDKIELNKLDKLGIKFVKMDEEIYIEVNIEVLEKLLKKLVS